MAVSIAVTNRKGGVGKTHISAHLAAYWATMGSNVLLIDTDPQGDGSRMFGMVPTNGLYNLLVPDEKTKQTARLDEVLVPVPVDTYSVPDNPAMGALFLLPSTSRTSIIALQTDDPFILADKVDELKEIFDVIVIDTAPTITAFDAYINFATDFFVFVTQCEPLSKHGVIEGIQQVKRFSSRREKQMDRKSGILKVVPNMVDARQIVHRTLMTEIVEACGRDLVSDPIMYRSRYKQATDLGKLIYAYAPSSGEAIHMRKMAVQVQEALQHELS